MRHLTYRDSIRDGAAFEYCLAKEEEGIALPVGWWDMRREHVTALAKSLGWNG